MKRLLVVFALLGIIVLLFAACSRDNTGGGGSGGGGGNTTVHLGNTNFVQESITIKKGDSLTFVNDVAVPHIIKNGSWDGTTAKPSKEDGAPTADLTFNGNDTKTIGPFTTAGTFHLYCTVHQGMNLTVTVQ